MAKHIHLGYLGSWNEPSSCRKRDAFRLLDSSLSQVDFGEKNIRENHCPNIDPNRNPDGRDRH